jgi:hypothetical protein
MNRRQLFLSTAKAALMSALGWSVIKQPAQAQDVLPAPTPPFKGNIGRTYKDSKPEQIPIITAPNGAPNVLILLMDDCGYGQWGTFGGQVPTPNLDRIAKAGLRYTRFHTTAMCAPTRAALLTGRNHHSAGTGIITELGDGYPGYSGHGEHRDGVGDVAPAWLQHGVLWQEPQYRGLGDQHVGSF